MKFFDVGSRDGQLTYLLGITSNMNFDKDFYDSKRYHKDSDDYFRFTHRGMEKIFELAGELKVLESGYDIEERRNNWQGSGSNNDVVPLDNFGAWRETWFTVSVLQKVSTHDNFGKFDKLPTIR